MAADVAELERYLPRHIPLSAAMGVGVASVDDAGVRLTAPLAPNVNHRNTAFGGSVGSLAILSAWTLVHVRLRETGRPGRIVIQRSSFEYLHPIHADFGAWCRAPEPEVWERFMDTLARRGRARITLHAEVAEGARVVGRFQGAFVASVRGEPER